MPSHRQTHTFALISGPLAGFLTAYLVVLSDWPFTAAFTAGITVLCAIWWIFEPLPIPVTSLIPIAVFPLFNVLDKNDVAESYGNSMILLLLGGFILSTAMEKSGAHRRIALSMINLIGGNSNRHIVAAFMCTAALLSMWISNTATTLMLLPVALAVLENAEDKRLTIPLLLGICYAASLGGIGTPIGTPPNLIFMKVYTENTGIKISFFDWMQWGIPVVAVFLPLMILWLTQHIKSVQHIKIPDTGEWCQEEIRVLLIFSLTALAWMTRQEPFGGWSTWFHLPNADDASVALSAAIIMFIIPNGKGGRLLDWETANKIPWGVLLLFSGGIAIAKAFMTSGLSAAIGNQLTILSTLPLFLVLLLICLAVTFLTEITSNTATTSLLMPILAVAGIAAAVDPALFMIPAAMSASCAFMLPVATAPNAIIFGTQQIPIQTMMKHGFVLNLIGSGIISIICYLLLA